MPSGTRRTRAEQKAHLRAGVRRAEMIGRRHLLRFPHRVRCPVCGWTGPSLAPSSRPRKPNRMCPRCGSSERYRALELLLRRRGAAQPGSRLLELSPVGTVQQTAVSLGYDYTSINITPGDRTVSAQADVCHLAFPDGTFDLIVCLHVLEHVADDAAAVREMVRALAPGGEVIVVVPRDPGRPVTYEDQTDDPEEYERYYGQRDHVRIYGADVTSRWRAAGVEVEETPWVEQFTPDVHRYAALTGNDDRFWVLRQPTS